MGKKTLIVPPFKQITSTTVCNPPLTGFEVPIVHGLAENGTVWEYTPGLGWSPLPREQEIEMSNEEHEITFGTLTKDGLANVRVKCPFIIGVPDHYRADGSCKCDDADERKRMIKEWGYTEQAFEGIPLRQG